MAEAVRAAGVWVSSQTGLPLPVRWPATSNTSLAAKLRPCSGPVDAPVQRDVGVAAKGVVGIVDDHCGRCSVAACRDIVFPASFERVEHRTSSATPFARRPRRAQPGQRICRLRARNLQAALYRPAAA